jgi:hypothetical protein
MPPDMQCPRTPGGGITGAKAKCSLGADKMLLPHARYSRNRRLMMAMRLDREADVFLFEGCHAAAELREAAR